MVTGSAAGPGSRQLITPPQRVPQLTDVVVPTSLFPRALGRVVFEQCGSHSERVVKVLFGEGVEGEHAWPHVFRIRTFQLGEFGR